MDGGETFRDHKVRLDVKALRPGERNIVKLYFLNAYRSDGVGLVSFVDPTNASNQYIKTQFATDFCHMIFPCFDQPDLMAKLRLSCLTEPDWTVISNDIDIYSENDE